MIKFRPLRLIVLVLLCSLGCASYGQISGTISGTVLDINGGVVPGAQVTLLALDHASNRVVLSDDQGHFSFSELASGKFTITVTSTGLETYSSSAIILYPGEQLIVPEFR